MDGLVNYSLPIQGLGEGIHEYRFDVDALFFKHFENAPVAKSDIEVFLTLDKRSSMLVLDFEFYGTVRTECDRCLAEIDLPIEGTPQLVVKFSEEEEPEDAEVIFMHPEAEELHVARFIYEFIVLAIPMIRVYDCELDEPRVCNLDMLDRLEKAEEPQDEPESDNPLWDALKKFKDNS